MSAEAVSVAALDRSGGERFQTLRRELGVSSFGINMLRLAPGERGRIHSHEHQEEVSLVLEGTLTLLVEREPLCSAPTAPSAWPPGVRRQLVNAGREQLVLLALGGPESTSDATDRHGPTGMSKGLGARPRRCRCLRTWRAPSAGPDPRARARAGLPPRPMGSGRRPCGVRLLPPSPTFRARLRCAFQEWCAP